MPSRLLTRSRKPKSAPWSSRNTATNPRSLAAPSGPGSAPATVTQETRESSRITGGAGGPRPPPRGVGAPAHTLPAGGGGPHGRGRAHTEAPVGAPGGGGPEGGPP